MSYSESLENLIWDMEAAGESGQQMNQVPSWPRYTIYIYSKAGRIYEDILVDNARADDLLMYLKALNRNGLTSPEDFRYYVDRTRKRQ